MRKFVCAALTAAALVACDNSPKFVVEGTISGAEGKTLYLEAAKIGEIALLDSVKLGEKGNYKFKEEKPGWPEFYRLRIENQLINFAVDSTETIKIDAPMKEFSTGYTVENSPVNNMIKEVSLKQIALQSHVDRMAKEAENGKILPGIMRDSLDRMVERYKKDMRENYIYAHLQSPLAYFTLYQRINGFLIFDPSMSKDDRRCFQAVATTMQQQNPESDRTKNICNFTLKSLREEKAMEQRGVTYEIEGANQIGIIDIELRDIKGNVRKLSDLKGKVVLLDFTAYQSEPSAAHNLYLRELYNKYSAQGLEIYQVALDGNEHYWSTVAGNLPWICVNDPSGVYSAVARTYNVQSIPTMFLINRNNELKDRFVDAKGVEAALTKLLG